MGLITKAIAYGAAIALGFYFGSSQSNTPPCRDITPKPGTELRLEASPLEKEVHGIHDFKYAGLVDVMSDNASRGNYASAHSNGGGLK
ncbi:hypothetical protein HYV82_02890 [Candidatus Woesearchaeota archaeon]|nr:hypothetical protein [Candidatus Woesearchaeota archaeon]